MLVPLIERNAFLLDAESSKAERFDQGGRHEKAIEGRPGLKPLCLGTQSRGKWCSLWNTLAASGDWKSKTAISGSKRTPQLMSGLHAHASRSLWRGVPTEMPPDERHLGEGLEGDRRWLQFDKGIIC